MKTVPSTTQVSVNKRSRPSSPWRLAIRRLRKNRMAMIGLTVLAIMVLFCFIGPLFSAHLTEKVSVANGNKAPNSTHWLGTDKLGRDVLTRTMLAGRISLTVGIAAMVVSVLIGGLLGAIAGYYRGWAESLIMRLADIMYSIPSLPLLILLGAVLSDLKIAPGARIYYVMFILGLIGWATLSRLVRSQVLSLREQEFMQAAEVLGLRDYRKIFRHLLPNTVPIIIVSATLTVASAILAESALSWLGIGVIPPTPSWGNMIQAANNLVDFQLRPWLWIPPGISIFVTVISINLIGDGLRDALDPKMKR
ncbi:oligopeptide ABC transporter permease [Paenibacillus sp. J2TS4]|uniref:oligopeptide ABC transporter permease n=1 Tax=Paenibacillus sp. J2TS4 TaxID=2807194 RepID=UPI001B2EC674|nr:oligopeptide ABC transporter permease [Paenibacillus sp. J2TS4]GIP32718.1 peptide ABC transporter permease [Paenibacillus sp. J2TS4]